MKETNARPAFFSRSVERERTFFFSHPVSIEGLSVICGGREHCSVDYRIERESFPYHCIEFVESGKGKLDLNGTEYELEPGAVFIYGPGIRHCIKTHPEERLVKSFVDFAGPKSGHFLRRNRLAAPGFYRLPAGGRVLEIFDLLIESGADYRETSPRLCRLLLECLALQVSTCKGAVEEGWGRSYQTYLRSRDFILGNVRTLRQMNEVAAACHVDPAHLSRVFRRFGGESPHQFLMRHKMNAAALTLVRSGVLIKQIAEEFGFTDPYHFSRAFKKIHGLSPEAYRSRSLLP